MTTLGDMCDPRELGQEDEDFDMEGLGQRQKDQQAKRDRLHKSAKARVAKQRRDKRERDKRQQR